MTAIVYDTSGNTNSTSTFIDAQNLITDLNGDGEVNIQDIAIVGVAYGFKLGDSNWNPLADLDKNGIINIVDVVAVAKEYGKTS